MLSQMNRRKRKMNYWPYLRGYLLDISVHIKHHILLQQAIFSVAEVNNIMAPSQKSTVLLQQRGDY
jgi:hypothetical protein